jgi:hypothetical protein
MLRLRLELAEMLHKSLAEVEAMPVSEYTLWVAYSKIRERERKLEQPVQHG